MDNHRADLSEILASVEGVVRPSMTMSFCYLCKGDESRMGKKVRVRGWPMKASATFGSAAVLCPCSSTVSYSYTDQHNPSLSPDHPHWQLSRRVTSSATRPARRSTLDAPSTFVREAIEAAPRSNAKTDTPGRIDNPPCIGPRSPPCCIQSSVRRYLSRPWCVDSAHAVRF